MSPSEMSPVRDCVIATTRSAHDIPARATGRTPRRREDAARAAPGMTITATRASALGAPMPQASRGRSTAGARRPGRIRLRSAPATTTPAAAASTVAKVATGFGSVRARPNPMSRAARAATDRLVLTQARSGPAAHVIERADQATRPAMAPIATPATRVGREGRRRRASTAATDDPTTARRSPSAPSRLPGLPTSSPPSSTTTSTQPTATATISAHASVCRRPPTPPSRGGPPYGDSCLTEGESPCRAVVPPSSRLPFHRGAVSPGCGDVRTIHLRSAPRSHDARTARTNTSRRTYRVGIAAVTCHRHAGTARHRVAGRHPGTSQARNPARSPPAQLELSVGRSPWTDA